MPRLAQLQTLREKQIFDEEYHGNIRNQKSTRSQLSEVNEPLQHQISATGIPENMRLDKLQREMEKIIEDETVDVYEVGPKLLVINDFTIRDKTQVKRIMPNSTIDVACAKGIEHFYRLPYDGWKFPLIVSFNLQVIVDVYVSFSIKKPSMKICDYRYLNQGIIRVDGPSDIDQGQSMSAYICIDPQCSFRGTMTVKFDGKDYSKFKRKCQDQRKFNIDYGEMSKFSQEFYDNQRYIQGQLDRKKEHRRHASSSLFEVSQMSVDSTNALIARYFDQYKASNTMIQKTLRDRKAEYVKDNAVRISHQRIKSIKDQYMMKKVKQDNSNQIMQICLASMTRLAKQQVWVQTLSAMACLSRLRRTADIHIDRQRIDTINRSTAIAMRWIDQTIDAIRLVHRFVKARRLIDRCRIAILNRRYFSHRRAAIDHWRNEWQRCLVKLTDAGTKKQNMQLMAVDKNERTNDHGLVNKVLDCLYQHTVWKTFKDKAPEIDLSSVTRKLEINAYYFHIKKIADLKAKLKKPSVNIASSINKSPKQLTTRSDTGQPINNRGLLDKHVENTTMMTAVDDRPSSHRLASDVISVVSELDIKLLICSVAGIESSVPLSTIARA